MKKVPVRSKQLIKMLIAILFGQTVYAGTVFSQKPVARIYFTNESPQLEFSLDEIQKVLIGKNYKVEFKNLNEYPENEDYLNIIFAYDSDKQAMRIIKKMKIQMDQPLDKEGFCIRVSKSEQPVFWVIAADNAGLMYGGFEMAELISTGGFENVRDITCSPYMKMRGTKFNVPLDVRTPSYSDLSDAGQKNIPEMWNFDFWKEYIDSLARYRYNFISLWSMHPFPSLVKVPDYPEVALNDVYRSVHDFDEHYSLSGHNFDEPAIVNNYDIVRKMSIEEKINFWQKVMSYGKERNVDFYIITWNIFTYGVDGKYGITNKADNPVTRDYFRKSIAALLRTYPDLAGVGLTTGENMYGLTTQEKEEWAYETYGRGVLEVAKEQPEREITLIHRQHMTGALDVAEKFDPLIEQENVNFIFSFKYAKAHVYSSIGQVYHQGFVEDIRKNNELETIWTLRNDDIYYFRWGAPAYVRDFLKNIPYEVSRGYYYGSDNYIWGRDFMSKNQEGSGKIEIAKHWYHWMMWGRLGYDPEMSDERFMALLERMYTGVNGKDLFMAWQNASMIYPLVTGFHWGSLDFQWYIEAGQSRPESAFTPSGYHDVNRFITLYPHEGTNNVSIPEYVNSILNHTKIKGKTPPELAEEILKRAEKAMKYAETINAQENEALFNVINDIRSMSYLGKYYAHKIRAATNLALFRETYLPEYQQEVKDELNKSAMYWRYFVSNSIFINNNPLWTNRVGDVDWKENFQHALYDITANGGEISFSSMEPSPGGKIIEAEECDFENTGIKSLISGFTGTGYIESDGGHAIQKLNFSFSVPEAGNYIMEIRYSLKRQVDYPVDIEINGRERYIELWPSGTYGIWVWDRLGIKLEKGENEISIQTEGNVVFDHINLIKK